jgi:hypothetical protein
MASTYSSLKFELIGTGEQDGIWGDTTNTNIGTAIEQAITGSGNVTFTSADVTLTLTDANTTQTARNLRLVLIGTSDGNRQLIVPAIEKQYIIKNEVADTVTVKNSTGTGVAVPSGATMVVFNDGTNVVDVTTHATTLTVTGAFTTGTSNATTVNATTVNTTTITATTANATTFNGTTVNATTANATTVNTTTANATTVTIGGFNITANGTALQFKFGSTVVMSMDSTGNITSATNITAYGTP